MTAFYYEEACLKISGFVIFGRAFVFLLNFQKVLQKGGITSDSGNN